MRFCIALVSQKFPNAQFSVLHLKGFETIILIFPFMFCIEGPCLLSKVHLSINLTFNEKNGKVCGHRKLTLKAKFWHFLTLFDTSSLHQFSKPKDFKPRKIIIGTGYYLAMSFEVKIEKLSPSFLFYIAPGNSSISKVRH